MQLQASLFRTLFLRSTPVGFNIALPGVWVEFSRLLRRHSATFLFTTHLPPDIPLPARQNSKVKTRLANAVVRHSAAAGFSRNATNCTGCVSQSHFACTGFSQSTSQRAQAPQYVALWANLFWSRGKPSPRYVHKQFNFSILQCVWCKSNLQITAR